MLLAYMNNKGADQAANLCSLTSASVSYLGSSASPCFYIQHLKTNWSLELKKTILSLTWSDSDSVRNPEDRFSMNEHDI